MLDEEMDHMIRQAAENHHPPYNDKAWEKMEVQLDKHLPQKKDRKKLIFFLLFFLLLGGGLLFTVNRFMDNKEQLTENEQGKKDRDQSTAKSLSKEPATENNVTLTPGNGNENENDAGAVSGDEPGDAPSTNDQTGGNKTTASDSDDSKNRSNNSKGGKTTISNPNDGKTNAGNSNAGKTTISNPDDNKNMIALNDAQKKKNANRDKDDLNRNKKFTKTRKGKTKINIAAAKPFEELPVAENALITKTSTTKKKPVTGKTADKLNVMVTAADPVENDEEKSTAPNSPVTKNEADTKTETNVKTEPEKEVAKVKQDEKEKEPVANENRSTASTDKKPEKKFASNFGLTFSVGPDASFVSLNRFGKITFTYGAGLSYNFANRLTVRTGFYSTKKIYTASADQYHTPGGNYPHLVDVDANCKVYEIPLSLSYSFGQRKNHNWFGNVGLSSFIMKTEDYTYNYKNYNQAYSYNQKVSNENKHYFSVLTVSGGYNYRFNKRVSIQAEPYLQLPLSGVGFGKIKLNSTGILFTVTVKPFAKKK